MHTIRSPQKLLFRHRTYHKQFIDDEDFSTLHAENQLPLCPRRRYIGITAVKFPMRRDFRIVGSCNGILCLYDRDEYTISLWNPSIRRKLTLPDCPRRCFTGQKIGFGFDPITDDYKIVSISSPRQNGGIVESSFVYSMKTRTWCAITSPTPWFSEVASYAVFFNGALHWVVGAYSVEPRDVRHYILTFDLSTQVFGMIELPDPSRKASALTTIKGFLAAIFLTSTNIWIWARRDDSWFRVFKSESNKVQGGLTRVLHTTSNGGLLFKTFTGEVLFYNPKIGAPTRLVNLNDASQIYDVEMCVESLELLDISKVFEQ
ncbi:hypothetical protein L2E82_03204 [Cichorium intybus]|uniref:Uncharacterized protein n=1 Tax=Cichorium intybus TaxID=13427 RepID=A0ACB9H3H0_CICIN|nr:hypothetical protein L2E82_03204 [Cichorium intybus]